MKDLLRVLHISMVLSWFSVGLICIVGNEYVIEILSMKALGVGLIGGAFYLLGCVPNYLARIKRKAE